MEKLDSDQNGISNWGNAVGPKPGFNEPRPKKLGQPEPQKPAPEKDPSRKKKKKNDYEITF